MTGSYSYDFFGGIINITLTNGWTFEIDLTNLSTATVTFRESPGSPPDIQQALFPFNRHYHDHLYFALMNGCQ